MSLHHCTIHYGTLIGKICRILMENWQAAKLSLMGIQRQPYSSRLNVFWMWTQAHSYNVGGILLHLLHIFLDKIILTMFQVTELQRSKFSLIYVIEGNLKSPGESSSFYRSYPNSLLDRKVQSLVHMLTLIRSPNFPNDVIPTSACAVPWRIRVYTLLPCIELTGKCCCLYLKIVSGHKARKHG